MESLLTMKAQAPSSFSHPALANLEPNSSPEVGRRSSLDCARSLPKLTSRFPSRRILGPLPQLRARYRRSFKWGC